MKKYIVTLTEDERSVLGVLASKGKHKSQKILNISMKKIDRVKRRFVKENFEVALNGKKGSRVYTKKADGDFEAHLVALSCSKPPEGFARWSLRLLAEKVVELNYIDSISHEEVRRVLKKTKSNPGNGMGG